MATISYETESAGVLVTNVLFFDATMGEEHEGTADVTEHEVERGSDLADNIRPGRPALTLQAIVTNTPIESIGRLQGAFIPTVLGTSQRVINDGGGPRAPREPHVQSNFVQPGPKLPGVPRYTSPAVVTPGGIDNTPVVFTANLFTFPVARDRVLDMWQALNKLRAEGTELKVFTRLEDYESMFLTRISAPVRAEDAITFSLVFKQIGFSDSLTFSEVNKVKRVAVKKAAPKTDEGPKDPYTIGANTAKSVWARGLQWITGVRSPEEVLAAGG